jgi:hypothetical protein
MFFLLLSSFFFLLPRPGSSTELNFPIGQKTKLPLSPRRWHLPMHMLDSIFYGTTKRICVTDFKPNPGTLDLLKSIHQVLIQGEEEYAIQMNPHPILLSDQFYQTKLRGLMGEWAYVWLREQSEIKMGITHTTKTSKSGGSIAQSAFMRQVSEQATKDQPRNLRGRSNNDNNDNNDDNDNKQTTATDAATTGMTTTGGGALLRQSSGPAGPDGKGYTVSAVEMHLIHYLCASIHERKTSEELVRNVYFCR